MSELCIIVHGARGRSIIATTNIAAGTVILIERPSLVFEDVYDAVYSLYSESDIDVAMYEDLAPAELDAASVAFHDLVKDFGTLPRHRREFLESMEPERLRLLATKYIRNAFTYDIQYGGPTALLFKACLMNHSCDPNVSFEIINNGMYVFKTNRQVLLGEELCDSYIDITLPRESRQIQLRERYGFSCTCAKCDASI